ncbi:HAD-superfamily hydrolase [Salinarchaeum sp. Harcht-Bsk1]|uniref:HAD family hydrolase n=1 Tax=Salinarchaeum sp. Harcht-Bsk1 TaxID=1333523 RepID=UPI0003423C31|nr:HAD family hydrolase [Salinarchaeum sp. Harcht-Bsk1]AGN00163.1 HAD-superfamily hydrolase [Salinarchaeum sp. Harcht-Bsk1]
MSDERHTASGSPDVEAVFWDIGGVILAADSVRTAHRAFVEELVTEYSTSHTAESALEVWRTTVGEYFRERDGTEFRPARKAYRLAIDEILDESVEDAEWRPSFRAVLEEHARPNPGAVEAIERLAAAPVHLGVISDVDEAEGRRLLETFGVLETFDSVTTSEAVGRTKPDPAMFETALETAGVEPSRAAMIGDRYDHDVAGSAEVGMTAVAYGADDGPAVDHRIEELRELPALLGFED